jgi:serine/threonine protein kinase
MEPEAEVGQLIAGKYRMEHVLGRGGMGVVVAALHEQLNQRVALKFLTDDAYQQPEAVARFVREARAAVQIQSEHVARVMDVGTLDSGAPYMVMEYLRGMDLKEVSTRRGALPISEAVDFVLQACDAVAEAHSLGIVHRDLKPSNLFLTERPDGSPMVKVLDFGISKALYAIDQSQLQMTASAAIMGSPQYMSPEQIRSSKNVDARADVWALGTILHELLTGSPAYVADTVPGLLAMIVADAPPPLSSRRPGAPADLEAIILRCLQKDRELRFANVSEFARSLERYASPETRPLIRRIARVLGDRGQSNQAFAPAQLGQTHKETVGQTNGTWASTGRLNNGLSRTPAYQKTSVQLGFGLGAIGVGIAAWMLLVRSAPEDRRSEPNTAPHAAQPQATASEQIAPGAAHPNKAVAGSAEAAAPRLDRATVPATGVGVIRPVTDSWKQALPDSPDDDAEAFLADSESERSKPKASEATASKGKKKTTSATASARRSTPPAPLRRTPQASAASEAAPQAPTTVAPKKSSTLDLFNDTK